MEGMFSKNSTAVSIVIFKTSEIDLPLYLISSVSLLYLFPLQVSQFTYTSERKFISIFRKPAPKQVLQRPPTTLKENLPGLYPLIFASGIMENKFLISVNTFV